MMTTLTIQNGKEVDDATMALLQPQPLEDFEPLPLSFDNDSLYY